MVIVISALSMLLFHWRILPFIVKFFSTFFQKGFGIGGALGVCAAAKMFLGQTEAPLLVRPYLGKFTRSELFTVMTAGMATTSISIMVLYALILQGTIPDPIAHILTASIVSVSSGDYNFSHFDSSSWRRNVRSSCCALPVLRSDGSHYTRNV